MDLGYFHTNSANTSLKIAKIKYSRMSVIRKGWDWKMSG